MNARKLTEADIPAVKAIYDASGYGFDFPDFKSPLIEAAEVLVDDSGAILMAAAAKRVPEIYLFCPQGGSQHPFVKLVGMKMLHEAIRDRLAPKGYTEAAASLPPHIVKNHGRHLERKFGWEKAWPTYLIRDWKR